MAQRLALFSGPLAVGKSTVAQVLIAQHNFESIRSGAYLRKLAASRALKINRTNLQQLGDSLDTATDFAWIVDDVAAPTLCDRADHENWLLDSVRKKRQVEHFRARLHARLLHVHFTADDGALRQRYETRAAQDGDYEGGVTFETAIAHPNEASARGLESEADLVIDLTKVGAEDAARVILRSFEGK